MSQHGLDASSKSTWRKCGLTDSLPGLGSLRTQCPANFRITDHDGSYARASSVFRWRGRVQQAWRQNSDLLCHTKLALDQRARTRSAPNLALSTCTTRLFVERVVKCLFVCVEEVVVGRVPHKLSLTDRASASGGRSTFRVQTLDEGDICQEATARWPLLVAD
jgi:hypothetical protein